jgi:hypothetical protein
MIYIQNENILWGPQMRAYFQWIKNYKKKKKENSQMKLKQIINDLFSKYNTTLKVMGN